MDFFFHNNRVTGTGRVVSGFKKKYLELTNGAPIALPFKFLPKAYRHMFNFVGRTSRHQHKADNLIIAAGIFIFYLVLYLIKLPPKAATILMAVFLLLSLIAFLASTARRLKDAGSPPEDCLLMFSPFGLPFFIGEINKPTDYGQFNRATYDLGEDIYRKYDKKTS